MKNLIVRRTRHWRRTISLFARPCQMTPKLHTQQAELAVAVSQLEAQIGLEQTALQKEETPVRLTRRFPDSWHPCNGDGLSQAHCSCLTPLANLLACADATPQQTQLLELRSD